MIFNHCCEFRGSPEGPVSQIHSPHLQDGAPGIFSDPLRFVKMLRREWDAESNGKLVHLFIRSKTFVEIFICILYHEQIVLVLYLFSLILNIYINFNN